MKIKKILAGVLSAAMALGTLTLPAFADESNYVTIGNNTETYDTLLDAINATKAEDVENNVITYNITGKVSAGNGYINFAKNVEDDTTIVFAGTDENAELALNDNDANGANILWNDSKPVTINVKNLICSREGGVWIGNAAQMNQYFSICANGDVTYTDCVLPDGAGAGYWKNTTFSGCTFKNDNGSETFKDTYGLWFRGVSGNKVTVKDNCVFDSPKGIKTYSDDQSAVLDTEISDTTFNCTDSPAIIASNPGTITATDINVDNCAGGVARNDKGAEITVDGKAPAYTAVVDGKLYTDKTYAEKEAADKGTTAETIVAMVGNKYYATIDEAVEAAQAATTDKWHIAKITLLTNDALDVSKGPDNYISYNITKNDTVITGERIADDAHKSYYKLTNASTLYIPADVDSLILENVKNLCRIELAKGADVTLKLNGDNELAGNIFVPEGAKLTIEDVTADGSGRLAVYNSADKKYIPRGMNAFGAGDNYSAAIGGSQTQNGGEIVIKNGEIEAYSNYGSAIGGGQQKTAKVTILGGKIKAEASYGCAIGGGQQSVGDVTISGGIIDAKSDRGAAIGGGQQATGDSNIIISGGDITVASDFGENLLGNSTGEPAGAKISGGTFNVDASDYCEDGFSPKLVNGKYVVDDSADELKLFFKQNTDDANAYDIMLSGEGKNINRLNAADLTFKLDTIDKITYEVSAADGMSIIPQKNDRYEFHFNGKTGITTDSGAEVKIGTVKFDGYGSFKFYATDGKITATTTQDNLVTEFVSADTSNKGKLEIAGNDSIIDTTRSIPVKTLTVNVSFPHEVNENAAEYQDMTVEISGGDLAGAVKTFKLGNTNSDVDANTKTVAMTNGAYTVSAELTQNITYNVTVSGAGYRTARHTVNMSDDKVLNFWNNVKSEETEVEVGNTDTKMIKNFLAGDIVKDGNINIYDLSAIVSYFNPLTTSLADKYAKYDSNRDGKIDMMDISIILTSWNE